MFLFNAHLFQTMQSAVAAPVSLWKSIPKDIQMARLSQFLVFCLDERFYALRLSQVDRVIRALDATPLPQAPDIVIGAIDLQGEILPLLSTRRRFGIADREISPDDQFIIARTSRRRVALAVDGVKDVIQRPVEEIVSMEEVFHPLHHVEGIIRLDDELTLIHDLDRFLSLDEELALQKSLSLEPILG